MAVVVELRRPGKNGKLWLIHPRPEVERSEIIRLAHESRCELGMSYRTVRQRLAEHGFAVSLGAVHLYCREYECDRCAG